MKHVLIGAALVVVVSLIGCTTTSPGTPTLPAPGYPAEEAEIRALVEHFGRRLQAVSLLSPSAAQEMQQQYAEFVSPNLLEAWKDNPARAPGRLVSSPWPDRIEVTTVTKESSDKYVLTGSVVELTSVEVVSGGVAARIPVRIVVQNDQGDWAISEYVEER